MATAGKRIVLASGKFGVLSGGKVSVADSDGDCPECCGAVCVFCSGTVPETFEVVTSGIGVCACAAGEGGTGLRWYSSSWEVEPSIGPNGTFQLEHVSDCKWSLTQAVTGSIKLYHYANCNFTYDTANLVSMVVQFEIRGGEADLFIWYTTDTYMVLHAFRDSVAISNPVDCGAEFTLTNEASCGAITGTQNHPYLYENGSATVNDVP